MAEITVRDLRASDEAVWRGMWRDYLAFYETTRPEAIYAETFRRLLGDDPRDFKGLIAEVDGRPLGLAHYVFHRHGWQVEDTCYLQDLYTAPQARGLGAGRALIEAVYAAADAHGARGVYWLTQQGNATARQLYDRVGRQTDFIRYQRPA